MACAAPVLSGCHTLTGVVSGPALGGVSLTSRLWNSDSSVPSKVVVTPFAFTAGTLDGPFVTVTRGAHLDLEQPDMKFRADGYLRVLDAFEAGLFDNNVQHARLESGPVESQPSSASSHLTPQSKDKAGG